MLRVLQLFCMPGLFGIIIFIGYVLTRSDKSWLNNLANGLMKITFGVISALVAYGVASSLFIKGSAAAPAGGLTMPGMILTGIGLLIGLFLFAAGAVEIVRTTRRKDQGDESFIKTPLWFWKK